MFTLNYHFGAKPLNTFSVVCNTWRRPFLKDDNFSKYLCFLKNIQKYMFLTHFNYFYGKAIFSEFSSSLQHWTLNVFLYVLVFEKGENMYLWRNFIILTFFYIVQFTTFTTEQRRKQRGKCFEKTLGLNFSILAQNVQRILFSKCSGNFHTWYQLKIFPKTLGFWKGRKQDFFEHFYHFGPKRLKRFFQIFHVTTTLDVKRCSQSVLKNPRFLKRKKTNFFWTILSFWPKTSKAIFLNFSLDYDTWRQKL